MQRAGSHQPALPLITEPSGCISQWTHITLIVCVPLLPGPVLMALPERLVLFAIWNSQVMVDHYNLWTGVEVLALHRCFLL